jgi:dihydrofolate synthase/folylpolyglutamate synthase
MTYRELLARLYAARRFGMKLGLERIRAVLEAAGSPHARLGRVIHVAGTNGKGSTVAMIAALAKNGGARVATYTSPHLSTLRERIQIDGELVSEDAVVAAAERVGGADLTFFEQITAIGLALIADAHVDVTVLEVGLGGRLDATNVVDAPVAVLTGVALDHEAILGDTLAAIAREKAGICKRGQRVVVGASGEPEGQGMLVELARAAGASVRVADRYAGPLAMAGEHQRANAAVALAAAEELGVAHDPSALAHVVHPGRFERVRDLILDGAHNPHGARALAATLGDLRPTLVAAISSDKNARAIADALAPAVRHVIATRYQQERALDPSALADVFRASGATTETAPDLTAALALARRHGGPILVAGSLFLVGEARVLELGAPADPIALSDPSR